MHATVNDAVNYYQNVASHNREYLKARIHAAIESLQQVAARLEYADYLPPSNGIIKSFVEIDLACAEYAQLTEMIKTFKTIACAQEAAPQC